MKYWVRFSRCKALLQEGIEWLQSYFPILLMSLLAMGTWWLVQNSPVFDTPRQAAAPGHTPDYTMENLSLRQFAPRGTLKTYIQGQNLRHYPDTDTLEIDHIRVRTISAQGDITTAQARLGWSNREGSELRLQGAARVTHRATARAPSVTFFGESITAKIPQREVFSDQPLTIERDGLRITADTLAYDSLSGIVQAQGRVRGVYQPIIRPLEKNKP